MMRKGYVLCREFKAWPDDAIVTTYYTGSYWTSHLQNARVYNGFDEADVKIPMTENLIRVYPMYVRENRSIIEERLYHK